MSGSLDIGLLRAFVAVARAGSMSAAAPRVGRTQSAVSMQMRRLEDLLGQSLFHREGNGVRPTSAGERLLVHADRILGAHDEALAEMSGGTLRGAITFGCPEDYLAAFLPEALRGFRAAHPAVDVEVVSAPTVELLPMLHRRRVEVALISEPGVGRGGDVLRRESFVWLGDGPAPRVLDSPILPLALSAPDTLDHRAAREALDRLGRPYRIAFASNGLTGLLAVVRSGQAISVVTRLAVPPDLSIIRDPLPLLPEVGIVLRHAPGVPSAAARGFGDYLRGVLARG
jgi:DNA-binding transcriptional LysR family regulator